FLFNLANGVKLGNLKLLTQAPPWMLLGGVMGALYIGGTIILAPRLGAATMVSLIIAGQIVASVILDHYGWFGLAQHGITLWRVVGVTLLISGVFLVQRF